jgi:hypothetical protein
MADRSTGVRCLLTTAVRSLPHQVQLRTAGQLRVLPVHKTGWGGGRSQGEVELPRAVLDEVDWAWEALEVTTDDGAVAHFFEDEDTGACTAMVPLARASAPQQVRCPIAGGGMAPSVSDLRLWDAELVPTTWSEPVAAADGASFILYDVPTTGTADLVLDRGTALQVKWQDGLCEPVEVSVDAEVCVRLAGAEDLHAGDRFEVRVGARAVRLEDGVGCARVRVGETVISQTWHTDMGPVEKSTTVEVQQSQRRDINLRPLPWPSESGMFVWPTSEGPRIVSVNGVAEMAGLRNGDIILAVDGVPTTRQPVHIALAGLDGSEPSASVTFERSDREQDITVMFEEAFESEDTGF